MHNLIETSLRNKKAPLNRLIRTAKETDSRRVKESNPPTLDILRNTLLSGLTANELEIATGPGRRFRDLLERTTSRLA